MSEDAAGGGTETTGSTELSRVEQDRRDTLRALRDVATT